METQIYNSLAQVITDQKDRKALNEYTTGVINALLDDKLNEEMEFDKRKFEVPEIKGIQEVKIEEPPKEEAKPAVVLVPKKEEDETKSSRVLSEGSNQIKIPDT